MTIWLMTMMMHHNTQFRAHSSEDVLQTKPKHTDTVNVILVYPPTLLQRI